VRVGFSEPTPFFKNTYYYHGLLALVLADDCSTEIRENTPKIIDDYRRRGAPFGDLMDFSYLIDTVHLVNSADHMQLCDLILYAVGRAESAKPTNSTTCRRGGENDLG
jgi:hypothetical protein